RAPRRRRRGRARAARLLPVAALVAILAVGSLTPPGDAVATFVREVVSPPPDPPRRPLVSAELPGGGRLLATGAAGPVVVGGGRSPKRLTGRVDDATFSARGRFVAIARGPDLIAVDLSGQRRWSLHRDAAVQDPRWDQRDGFRVAYRSGGVVWVVNGDGTGDRPLGPVGEAAPAFRPRASHELAWADAQGVVTVRDLDAGVVRWRQDVHHPVLSLAWSPDGRRLVVVSRDRAIMLSGVSGASLVRWPAPPGTRNVAAAWSARNDRYAVLRHDGAGRWRITLSTPGVHNGRHRPTGPLRRTTLLALNTPLRGLLWSPDGRWLVTASPREDQWLFVKPDGDGRLAAIRTLDHLAAGGSGGGPIPTPASWCCVR
ncbi:MAG: hypothetical protein JWO02_796, partial [Solirubrobacterales bacterium]|nr:hypothetical protein [Solirubrobacterales bacterium]